MCLAVPGRIVSVTGDGATRSGEVDFGGLLRPVSLALVPEAEAGDFVIVHVGVAISRLDEEAARETLATLQALARSSQDAGGGP